MALNNWRICYLLLIVAIVLVVPSILNSVQFFDQHQFGEVFKKYLIKNWEKEEMAENSKWLTRRTVTFQVLLFLDSIPLKTNF